MTTAFLFPSFCSLSQIISSFPLQLSFQFLFSIANTIFYSPVQNSHKEQQLRKVKEYPGTCEKDPCTQLWVMTLDSYVLTLNHFVYSKTVCTAPLTLRMNSIPILTICFYKISFFTGTYYILKFCAPVEWKAIIPSNHLHETR